MGLLLLLCLVFGLFLCGTIRAEYQPFESGYHASFCLASVCLLQQCLACIMASEHVSWRRDYVNGWSHQSNQDAAHTCSPEFGFHVCLSWGHLQVSISKPSKTKDAVAGITTRCKRFPCLVNLVNRHCLCRAGPPCHGSKGLEAQKADLGQRPHRTLPCAKSAEYWNKGLIYKVSHRKVSRTAVRVSHKSAQIESSFLYPSAPR